MWSATESCVYMVLCMCGVCVCIEVCVCEWNRSRWCRPDRIQTLLSAPIGEFEELALLHVHAMPCGSRIALSRYFKIWGACSP